MLHFHLYLQGMVLISPLHLCFYAGHLERIHHDIITSKLSEKCYLISPI